MKKLIYILTLSFATLMYTAAQDPEPVATEENSPAYAEESTREGRAMDADAAEAAGVSEIVVAGGNEGVAMMAAQSVDAGQITGNETITSGTTPSKITSYLLPNCMYSYTISWEYATALIGGQYDWRTVSGATGLDYQPGALTSTTYYRRVLNYNDGSQKQLYTNIVTKTVTATPTLNPGTISGTQIVNYPAAPLTLTNVTSPSSSAGSYTIFWECKEDLGSWQPTGTSMALSHQPGVLTKKTYFRRVVKTTNGTLTAYSNEVTVTVNFGSLSAGTIGSDQVKDKNTRPDEIKGINPITGTAGVPFSYWWEKSTTSASGPWTTVSGIGSSASGASVYGNNYHPPILSQTTWYRRVAWRDLDEYTTYSNVVKIRIPLNAGLLQKSNVTGSDYYNVKHPNFTAILNDIEPYSGEGAFSVFWESSQSKNGPWTIIPGATGNNYTPSGILKATTYYRRGVKLNSDASNVKYSNTIQYYYDYGPISAGSITPKKQQIQEFTPAEILQSETDPVTIVNGKYSVQWQKASDNGVWSDIPGATGLTYNPGKVYSTTNFRRVADIKLNDVTIITIPSNIVSVEVFSAAEWIALSNYITKRVPLVASADASALSTSQCMWTIQYMDGLGRPMQTIQKGFSPEGKDIVTLQEYDAAGRESKTWLPVPKNYGLGADNTGAYVPAADIKSFATAYYSNDAYPYTEPVYEASPLQKVTHQYGPGEAWRSADRPVRTNTSTNADGTETGTALAYLKCYRYSVTTTGIQNHGLYPKGRLTVTKTTDEDNQIYYEFKDNRDRVILQRRISSASEYLDTYYVYDDRGLLRYVLPPGASANLTSQTSWDNNNTYIAQFAYTYKYDGRGQCIEKKLPGADPIYYVYDKTDHLIASQDGVQRAAGLWSYTIPDKYGRTVMAGTCTKLNNLTLAPGVLNAIEVTAEYNGTNTAYMGYTPSVEITTSTLLAVNYYDIYDFLSGSATKTTFSGVTYDTSLETYGKRNDATRHHGMLTGSIAMQVDNSATKVSSVFFYDNRNRLVQTQTRNHLGGKSVGAFKYDFTGNVLQEYESHQTSASQTPDVMTRSYTYDHGNRMRASSSKLNSTTASMSYTYYAFGQLADKQYGSTTVTESRAYNIRGWLKSLSSSKLNMTLDYSGRYGGDITRIDWQHLGASTSHPARSYSFTYTPLGQYKSAGTTATNYSETGFVYDKMGNATAFRRNGATAAAIDNMTLAYTGNRLTTLTNNGTSYTYAYDANGNTTKDGLRALNLEYNFLNLVGKVKNASNTTLATYRWLPDGTKLGVSTPANTGFEYLGSLIYTRTGASSYTLESAPFDGGRIIAGSSYVTQYFVTDHLGSTRVAFNQSGTDLDRSDYYPTGERWADPALPATTNRWQYNGKERQTTGMPTTYSTYLDYGARMYDSKIGRWHTIDPLAEKYYPVSPYVYCLNNPIRFIDPDGRATGDFLDKNGKLLGTDGIDDGKTYVMKTTESSFGEVKGAGVSKSDNKAATNFISQNSGNTKAFSDNSIAYDNSIEIEGSSAARQAMVNEVSRDNGRGGTAEANNREYGGSIANGLVSSVTPGPVSNPLEQTNANIELPANVSTFHSHPSGTNSENIAGGTRRAWFGQSTSTGDVNKAGTHTHYVFGRGNGQVYIYNSSGVQAVIPEKHFVHPKR